MYKLCNLNKYNLSEFKKLEMLKQNFNKLNKDFFEIYSKLNPFLQYLLRKKIRLLKCKDFYIGYIWIEEKENNSCNISSMYVTETTDLIKAYSYLIGSLRGYSLLTYECEKNDYNFSLLESLGFKVGKGIVDMEINLKEKMQLELAENVSFKTVTIGKDEDLRCLLQNKIFYQDDRIPLEIEDIYYDEMQEYYCNDGAIFIKLGELFIGYGQIIIKGNEPYIVNFGLLPSYQNKGYGKLLLKYLLNICYSKGKYKVKIRVSASNLSALSLYKSVGFKEKFNKVKWYYKTH